jgi:Uma2 family endonuclease
MPITEKAFRKLALEDPSGHWELYCGEPRQKPGMTDEHNDIYSYLGIYLGQQLDRREFRVRINGGHVQYTAQNYFIPDVFVVPVTIERTQRGTHELESYSEPLPLVVEIWSTSTGRYDVNVKIAEYQRRGDQEIWRIHPYDRTLTAWVRQPDGSYSETTYAEGIVRPSFLPNVTIDLAMLFA